MLQGGARGHRLIVDDSCSNEGIGKIKNQAKYKKKRAILILVYNVYEREYKGLAEKKLN